MLTRFSLVVTLVTFGVSSSRADDRAEAALAKTASGMFAGLQVHTLPNGLRVYLLPVPGSPTVTTMVAYKVGAADEDKDQTGLSHYLEHLLFKGTDKLLPGDIDRATQRNGGRNNAYTSEDMTVYHFDFAADRWQQALEIEADRMRNVKIDAKHEFQQEKGAVIAELKGGEDRPFDLEYKAILPLLYAKLAPYSHPVIGEEAHVRGATAETIKRYYDKWYHPNNAALVIVGGFDPKVTLAKVTQLFAGIPKVDLPPRKPEAATPPRTTQVRKEFASKFEVPRAMIGFNTVASGDPDDFALSLLDTIVAGGRTGRLYKRLVEGERLCNAVSTMTASGRYPGWFAVTLEMLGGKDRARAEAVVFEELKRLASEPVTAEELARAKRQLLAGFVFSNEDIHALGDVIAQAVTVHDADYLKHYLERAVAVTPADIQRAAAKYFAPEKAVVVWSLPPAGAEGAGGATASPAPRRLQRQPVAGDASGAVLDLKQAKKTVLPNGLTVVTLENRRLPIVVADAYVSDVRLREPADKAGVATLVGSMLEEGTTTHTGDEIAKQIEDAGGSLSLSSSGGSVKVLTPDADLGLGLLFDSLVRPTFPADALSRVREQQLNEISEVETQPRNRAAAAFSTAVYGRHPYGRSRYGSKEIVAKLTAADCRAFHAKTFAPNLTTVVVVGDFATADMVAKIAALTKDWKPVPEDKSVLPLPVVGDKPTTVIVSDATAAQTHVFLGHLGVKRDDPDYYTLLVMDNVLGTGPGFTDRLSASLRDRQGLAYTVTAQIAATAGKEVGVFQGYVGTFPDKFPWVRDGFLREVNRIRDEPATAREVEDAKKYLLGSLPFRVATNSAVAAQLLSAERFGLGFDFLDTYRKKVAAVTVADVQAAARKHLRPDRIVVTAVGPIDAAGNALKPAPKK
jgi:zinc protease